MRPMKIDGHLFPTNMVDAGGKGNALQTKLLTSQSVKESDDVDPRVQVSADQNKGKGQQDEAECSRKPKRVSWADEVEEDEAHLAPRRRVTLQMLLNKWQ